MDYSSLFFGKTLNDVTYEDVEKFFLQERTETDQIEFKSFAGNLESSFENVKKTICGFLNSKGGLLILGAPHDDSHKKNSVMGSLTPIATALTRDQWINKSSDSIIPLPTGIRVRPINNSAGGQVIIFEVDESDHSPHQYKGIYYMRIDGQTRTAPHHYIEALFRKIKKPTLEAYIRFTRVNFIATENSYKVDFDVYFFNWTDSQNVIDLSYRMLISEGSFLLRYNMDSNISDDGKILEKVSSIKVLHAGMPFVKSHTFLIPVQNSMGSTLLLSFGAENTSGKICIYEINLSSIVTSDADSIVKSRTENENPRDRSNLLGMNRVEILKKFLGRNPEGKD
ncbi:MAG TPA: hypothetical protein DGG95_18155 [Cytophagales bacterium]|jgi:hypothetical protein|nr:hypothetical protein [Cytophagales bacterium]